MKLTVVTILAVLLFSGCAAVAPPGPIAWQEGYLEGCPSGQSAAGYVYASWQKDINRFNSDSLYAQGWADGYERCKTSFQHTSEISSRMRVFR